MVAKEIDNRASLKERLICLLISGLVFILVYNFCGWYASNSNRALSFVLEFEHYIPFVPWMVLPYMSSGLLFIAIFFCCSSRSGLLLLTKRINFITITSGIIFIISPLTQTFTKPDVDSSFLNFFFRFLNTWDTNYNQAPSLHISYIIVSWLVLRHRLKGILKTGIGIWLILMSISTLTIFQHHVIDVVASFALVSITFFVLPETKSRNYRIGMAYVVSGSLLLLFSLLLYQHIALSVLLIWISLTLFLIGCAYLRSDARFLKQKDGSISFTNRVLYLPYILTYRVIRVFFCRNRRAFVAEVFPSVFIGPRLSSAQAEKLGFNDSNTTVIDLSAEMEESCLVREKTAYYSLPILDIATIMPEDLSKIVNTISELYEDLKPNERIYIHCLMGYSRSAFLAALFISNRLNISIEKAVILIRKEYPYAIFPQHLLTLALNNKSR